MKYTSPNHDLVIHASGGHAVLERLGFVSKLMKEHTEKRAVRIMAFKEYFAKRKAEKEQQEKDLFNQETN